MTESDGCLVVFEGIDGSGTSTQSALYASYLHSQHRIVYVTCEPSTGPIGSMLRLALGGRLQLGASNQAETMALLFAADRLDHVAHEIGPHLRDGSVVLCDRYDLSSITYQTATSRHEDRHSYEKWVRTINGFATRPRATIVIDVDPDEAERRRGARHDAIELYETRKLQRDLAKLYARAEELVPDDHVIHIDGNHGVEEVQRRIRAALVDIVG